MRGGGKFVKVRVSIDPVREGPVVRQGGRQTGESVDRTQMMAVMAAGELNDGAESRCSPVARMFHGHKLVSCDSGIEQLSRLDLNTTELISSRCSS